MLDLEDYSGEFKHDLKLQDFSKDALARMWATASRLYILIDGLWHVLMKERYGKEVALELSREIWRRATPLEAKEASRTLNIVGHDVASCFKTWQVDPGAAGIMDLEFDLKNNNHGIFTVKRCRALDYYERHYDNKTIEWFCKVIDGVEFENYAHIFNPKIRLTPLKVPPRKTKEEIACQWELKIAE